jgi:hypothetical protein
VTFFHHTPQGRARKRKHAFEELRLAHKGTIGEFVKLVHVARKYGLQCPALWRSLSPESPTKKAACFFVGITD